MASDSALPPVIGAIADDRDGNALGTITTVFLDDVTQRPTWVGLTGGMHAGADDLPVIAPIADSEYTDGRLRLAVPGDAVRSAPAVSQPDRLSPAEEATLLEHYRAIASSGRHGTTDTVELPLVSARNTTDDSPAFPDDSTRAAETAPADETARTDDTGRDGARNGVGVLPDAATLPEALTRSEERLQVTTVVEPWTRAVLRIEEVTEEVMVPVTITRQQARIEYLPLAPTEDARTAGDPAEPGADRPTSTSEWVTLYAEQPSVTLERRPVERVRLSTSWVTEETTVSQEVRREQVELTTDTSPAT